MCAHYCIRYGTCLTLPLLLPLAKRTISRVNVLQETAAAIAKEFSASIEAYEARLLAVETGVKQELAEIKELLKKGAK